MKHNWSEKEIQIIQDSVLDWYTKNGRHHLPWRNLESYSIDVPYGVLVSEIMLQQTQVDRVRPKFLAFIQKFPTVNKLAKAPTADVIRLWARLGYNRRAVMLHESAKEIVNKYNGHLPSEESSLLLLSGVGPYTARAIMAFGFDLPIAVVDTNIKRFYQLLIFGYTQPKDRNVLLLAQQFVPQNQSSNWHAGIMDLMNYIRSFRTPAEQQTQLVEILALYLPKLPKLNQKPFTRPKQSRFIGSKRFYRGQIISLLRQTDEHKLSFMALKEKINLLEVYPYDALLSGLKKDGLVNYLDPLTFDSIVSLP